LTVSSRRDIDETKLSAWLSSLLVQGRASSIYRIKGILKVAGRERRTVVQGVHSLLNMAEDRPWAVDERRASHLVFIGRGLDAVNLRRGFRNCLA
jgi:G3E family GTPase